MDDGLCGGDSVGEREREREREIKWLRATTMEFYISSVICKGRVGFRGRVGFKVRVEFRGRVGSRVGLRGRVGVS